MCYSWPYCPYMPGLKVWCAACSHSALHFTTAQRIQTTLPRNLCMQTYRAIKMHTTPKASEIYTGAGLLRTHMYTCPLFRIYRVILHITPPIWVTSCQWSDPVGARQLRAKALRCRAPAWECADQSVLADARE